MVSREKLKRDLRREALSRLEDAARTVTDFENLSREYDKLDKLRERRERRNEILTQEIQRRNEKSRRGNIHFREKPVISDTVIPPPINNMWWRQLMRGDFIDCIYDCPFEIDELTSNKAVSKQLKILDDSRKEILYYRIIKDYPTQRIAEIREQSDRNIRKIYSGAIKKIRNQANRNT